MASQNRIQKNKVAFVYHPDLAEYELSPYHPLKPIRLRYMYELMCASSLLDSENITEITPSAATEDEILLVHDRDYLEVVKTISRGGIVPSMHEYGFGFGDNPPSIGMYEWSAMAAGATLTASRSVSKGEYPIAFAPAGGVHHHAMPKRASGFGVFNDVALAIAELVQEGFRVAYVDIDCHHGDGVQHIFYDSDKVLTISIHETGSSLFPGSGFVGESGTGKGSNYNINIPLAPYTRDDAWLWALGEIVPTALHTYRPDILFTQLGIDTHHLDPLTHLNITTQGFTKAVRMLARFSEKEVGRWVAVGGGGYDIGAVARGWTMALSTMSGFELPEQIPQSYSAIPDIKRFKDDEPPLEYTTEAAEIWKFAERTVADIKEKLPAYFQRRSNIAPPSES